MRRLAELARRDRVLALAGGAHVAVLAIVLLASLVDERTLLGVDRWLKPAKFLASGAAFLLTLAWLQPSVSGARRARSVVSWGCAVAMSMGSALIVLQAARGVRSHFNDDSGLELAIFGAIGICAFSISGFMMVFLWLTLRRPAALPRAWLWGVRVGTVGFLIAGFQGFSMLARGAHTVGAADGGPGLPLVNWSTAGGDLRIAHAVFLHSFQVVPLFAWLLVRGAASLSVRARTFAVLGFGLAWLMVGDFVQRRALTGRPLLGPGSEREFSAAAAAPEPSDKLDDVQYPALGGGTGR